MRIHGRIVCQLFFASYVLGPNVISGQTKESEEDRLVRQIMETEIFNDWFRGQSAGSKLTEVATAILAASGDEPTDLKLARGLNELYMGHSSSVDAKYIELSVQNELMNHQARSKLGQGFLERSIALGVDKTSYSHKIGLLQSAESNSQLPDPTWTAEMVRLVRLLRSASSPDVLKMRQERVAQIRALLPKHPEWKALNEVRSMVQAVGRAKERVKAFQQASSKASK